MSLARKLSYLCIQMNYTMEDLKNIRLTQTFMEFILHYLYFVFLKYLYYYKKIYTIDKKEFILFDNGIKIDTSFIPYEYIVNFHDANGYINLVLLAKIEEGQLVPFDAIFHLSFKSKCNSSIIKNIKSNLYYHIKYNNVNLDILSYNSVKISL